MAAQSIEWHQSCRNNQAESLERERANLERQRYRVEELEKSVELYNKQITTAIREGKKEFDRDKYLIGRK